MSTTSKSQTGRIALSEAVEIYASHMDWLETSREPDEVANALIWRDAIAEELEAGATLGAKDRACLEAADGMLQEKAAAIYAAHPEVFDANRDKVPGDYWWWKLGPGGADPA
jgi:hypothetical protein